MLCRSALALMGSLLVACGGSATTSLEAPSVPQPPASAEAEAEISEAEPVTDEESVVAEPTAEAPAEEIAEVAEPAPPPERKIELVRTTASGRPIVQYVQASGITTTLGQNGGILNVGDASLRIPEGALRGGMNVTFAPAAKVKGPSGAVGTVYKVAPATRTIGAPFQIVLPVPEGVGSVAFAVEMPPPGETSKKAKPSWQTMPATKVFTNMQPNLALLELDGLFEGHVTLVVESSSENP